MESYSGKGASIIFRVVKFGIRKNKQMSRKYNKKYMFMKLKEKTNEKTLQMTPLCYNNNEIIDYFSKSFCS